MRGRGAAWAMLLTSAACSEGTTGVDILVDASGEVTEITVAGTLSFGDASFPDSPFSLMGARAVEASGPANVVVVLPDHYAGQRLTVIVRGFDAAGALIAEDRDEVTIVLGSYAFARVTLRPGSLDAGVADAGGVSGRADGGPVDARTPDAGAVDAQPGDLGVSDAGVRDALRPTGPDAVPDAGPDVGPDTGPDGGYAPDVSYPVLSNIEPEEVPESVGDVNLACSRYSEIDVSAGTALLCGRRLSFGVVTSTQGAAGVAASVLTVDSLTIATNDTLRLTGDHPVILVVLGDVTIHGTLTVSAQGPHPGPGGDSSECGLDGAGVDGFSPQQGGSGGGFTSIGGAGGRPAGGGPTGGRRNDPNNATPTVPLRGGCGGGDGFGPGGEGGGGGGALQVSAIGDVYVGGVINAGGGGGNGGGPMNGSGGGGGTGGVEVIEANRNDLDSGAALRAVGGGGGGGASATEAGGAGENGPAQQGQAALGRGAGGGGNGSSGLTRREHLVSAGIAGQSDSGSGGGGAGPGRLSLRGVTACIFRPAVEITVPGGCVAD